MLDFDTERLESWRGVDSQWITEGELVSGDVDVVLWDLALLTIPSLEKHASLGFLPDLSCSFLSSSLLPSQFPSWSPFCIYLLLHLILPWVDSFTSGALTDKCCWLTNLSSQHVCLLNSRPRFPISCGYLAPAVTFNVSKVSPISILFPFCFIHTLCDIFPLPSQIFSNHSQDLSSHPS